MSYCYDFIRKFKKEGNFCGLDKSEVSRLEAYIEIIEMLMKQHIAEKTIIDNFPLGAARHLIPIKDERRADGLSFVTEQLKAGKHISGKDMQSKLEISNNKPKTKPESVKGAQFEKKQEPVILHPGIKKQDPTECWSPQPGIIPAPRKPACLTLEYEICPDLRHHIDRSNKVKGKCCDAINIPLNQLPHNECPLDREVRLKGTLPEKFRPASEDGMGNKFVKPPAYKIVPVKCSKEQFIESFRGYYTPKTVVAADQLVKSGVMGEDYAELIDALIWEASGRMGV